MTTASVSSIKLHLAAARILGISAEQVLRESSIPIDALSDPENRIDLDLAIKLILAIASRANVPSYGLWLGENFHPAKLNLAGYVVMNAANLGEALQVFCRFQKVIGDAFHWEIESVNESTRLIMREVRLGQASRLGQEWSPTALLTTARILTERPIQPLLVEFAHPCPDWEDEYNRFYGCEIRFDATQTALSFREDDLQLPVLHSDTQMAKQFQASLERILNRLESDKPTSQKVTLEITRELAGDVPTVESIAKRLAMSARSLQATLKIEGTTFKSILAHTRQNLAEERLGDQSLSIGEVSFLVGFSEPSAFHRAFKKWTGYTPGEYRDTL